MCVLFYDENATFKQNYVQNKYGKEEHYIFIAVTFKLAYKQRICDDVFFFFKVWCAWKEPGAKTKTFLLYPEKSIFPAMNFGRSLV